MRTTIPAPIVSWETVVSQSDPLREPTRQRLRTVRTSAHLTNGVRVTRRRNGRADGSGTYFSVLSALSVFARGAGEAETADALLEAGRDIEAWISPDLGLFLAVNPTDDLPQASFWKELVQRTGDALRDIDLGFVVLKGAVAEIHGNSVRIVDEAGEDVGAADLPLDVVKPVNTQFVWVMRSVMGSAAVLTVLPAVDADPQDAVAGERYWTDGPGAPISDVEAAYLRDLDVDSLPKARVLRPAG